MLASVSRPKKSWVALPVSASPPDLRRQEDVQPLLPPHHPGAAHLLLLLHGLEQGSIAWQDGHEAAAAGEAPDDGPLLRRSVTPVHDRVGLDGAPSRCLHHDLGMRQRVDPCLERRSARTLPAAWRRGATVDAERVLGQVPAVGVHQTERVARRAQPRDDGNDGVHELRVRKADHAVLGRHGAELPGALAVAEPGVRIARGERGRAGGEVGELAPMGGEAEAARGAKRVLEQRVGRDRLRRPVTDLELARAGPSVAPARRVLGTRRGPGDAPSGAPEGAGRVPRLRTRDQRHRDAAGGDLVREVVDERLRRVAPERRVEAPRAGAAEPLGEEPRGIAVVVADDGRDGHRVDGGQEPRAAARVLGGALRRLLHQEERLSARGRILGAVDRLSTADQDGQDAPALGWHGHFSRATRSALPWARERCQGEMSARTLRTPICHLFGIEVPIILAGMGAAQGTEAGGHTGEIGTLALVPQVVDAVKIPVVAAGGIVDGRGVVAALALGAQGAIIGTRFIATPEATAAQSYREALVRAEQDETIRTRCYSGKPLRSLRNRYIAEHEADPSRIRPFPEQLMISAQRRVMAYWEAEADPERTCFPAGQGVGAFREIKPAGELLHEIVAQAEHVLAALPA